MTLEVQVLMARLDRHIGSGSGIQYWRVVVEECPVLIKLDPIYLLL